MKIDIKIWANNKEAVFYALEQIKQAISDGVTNTDHTEFDTHAFKGNYDFNINEKTKIRSINYVFDHESADELAPLRKKLGIDMK